MNQLNLQHPPNQVASTSYGPLVPSAATVAPNASASVSAPSAHATPSPSTSKPQIAGNPLVNIQTEARKKMIYAIERRQHVLSRWTPRELTAAQRAAHTRWTQDKAADLRALYDLKINLAPGTRDSALEGALFAAYTDFQIFFPRTFRFNDLPTEIAMNIFRYAVWATPDPGANIRMRIRLSSVSRHWRSVALADTTLWNSVYFRKRADDERAFAFYDRAGHGPIDVRIDDSREEPLTTQALTKILDKVFEKLSSLHILVVFVQGWDPIFAILERFRRVDDEKLPMILERIELHRIGQPYVDPAPWYHPVPLFGGATIPSFRWLSLNGVHINWNESNLSSLTTLDLRRVDLNNVPSLATFRAMLRDATGLEKMILDGAGPDWDAAASRSPPVPLLSLKILVLGGLSDAYAAYILSQFTCPNVVDLTILGLIGNQCDMAISMLTSKTPNVQKLSFYNLLPPDHDVPLLPQTALLMAKWLKSMPELVFLRLGRIPSNILEIFLVDQNTFRRINPNGSPSKFPMSPKLICVDYHLPYSDYLAIWVALRRRMECPLRSLYMLDKFAARMVPENHKLLMQALTPGRLYVTSQGVGPKEEKVIIDSAKE